MTTPKSIEEKKASFNELYEVAKWIYEATRLEAEWSKRPIVPEAWEDRDDKFREQFVNIITEYLSVDRLPTPAEAHESWNQSYYKMGYKYGEIRDVKAKTHPDLVPFSELPQPEKDKDAIFLAFVWLARQLQAKSQILALLTTSNTEARIDELRNIPWKSAPKFGINTPYVTKTWLRERIASLISKKESKK